jgi:phospholipid/cholesterol/gamma-HCH transport system substrate-binding protein
VREALQPPRFRYTNEAVGLFVLVAVLVFVTALLYSGQVRKWFKPGETLKVVLPEAGLFGLTQGSTVEILGTVAGDVTDIVIDPNQRMYADVRIDREMVPFIRSDSKATIRKTFGIAGDAYLEISRGSGQPLDWQEAVIIAKSDRQATESLGEMIDELRSKIFPVIDDSHAAILIFLEVVKDLQASGDEFEALLASLKSISGKLSRGEGSIGRLLTEDQLARELENLISRLNQDLKHVDPILTDLKVTTRHASEFSANINEQSRELPEISQSLKDTLASVEAVMTDLRRTTPQLPKIAGNVSDASDSLPVLVLQIQQVMVDLELLVKQLQSHWLFGGKPQEAPGQSSRITPLEVSP